MKAYISSGHFHVFIDWNDYEALVTEHVVSEFQDYDDGNLLGKRLRVVRDPLKKRTEHEYSPNNESWEQLNVILSDTDYEGIMRCPKCYPIRIGPQSIDFSIEDDLSGLI